MQIARGAPSWLLPSTHIVVVRAADCRHRLSSAVNAFADFSLMMEMPPL
jgi:hypothetical protein